MPNISVKGVLIGGIAAVVAQNFLAILAIPFALAVAVGERSPGYQAPTWSGPAILAVVFVLLAGCSAFGGYLSARLAKCNELLNGSLSSWLWVAIGTWAVVAPNRHTFGSPSFLIACIVFAPIAALAGGYVRLRHVARRAPQA